MYPIINILGMELASYGVCCVIGGTLAILLALYNTRYTHFDRFDLLEACTFTLIGGFLGAKLLYLLVSTKEIHLEIQENGFSIDLLSSLLQGGFVFYGGLLGGMLTLFLFAKWQEASFLDYLTAIAPSVPLAHAFGRIGCFLAGCCYGIPLDSSTNPPLFPVQLLESGCNLVLAAVLQIGMRKWNHRERIVFCYLIAYAMIRMVTEQFRYDAERGFLLGISTSEWISIGVFLCGLVGLVYCIRKKQHT